jgi:hypothetical protein
MTNMPNPNIPHGFGSLTALISEIDDFCGTRPPRKFPRKKDELRDALLAAVIQNLAGEIRNGKIAGQIQKAAGQI